MVGGRLRTRYESSGWPDEDRVVLVLECFSGRHPFGVAGYARCSMASGIPRRDGLVRRRQGRVAVARPLVGAVGSGDFPAVGFGESVAGCDVGGGHHAGAFDLVAGRRADVERDRQRGVGVAAVPGAAARGLRRIAVRMMRPGFSRFWRPARREW